MKTTSEQYSLIYLTTETAFDHISPSAKRTTHECRIRLPSSLPRGVLEDDAVSIGVFERREYVEPETVAVEADDCTEVVCGTSDTEVCSRQWCRHTNTSSTA